MKMGKTKRPAQGSAGKTGPGPSLYEPGDPDLRAGPEDMDDWSPRKEGSRFPDATQKYLREIKNIPHLSAEREIELAKRVSRGDRAARNELVRANIYLAAQYAARWASAGMPLQDLINEGCLGLIKAAERFDYTRGVRFSTYAWRWVERSIQRANDERARIIRLPAHARELNNRLKEAEAQLEQKLGRAPTARELAAEAEIPEQRVENIRRYRDGLISLDAPEDSESGANLWDYVPSGEGDPFQLVSASMLRGRVHALLDRLEPRERQVLILRYGLLGGAPYTPEETGRTLHLPREQARRIEEKALRKLRRPCNLSLIYDYRYSS